MPITDQSKDLADRILENPEEVLKILEIQTTDPEEKFSKQCRLVASKLHPDLVDDDLKDKYTEAFQIFHAAIQTVKEDKIKITPFNLFPLPLFRFAATAAAPKPNEKILNCSEFMKVYNLSKSKAKASLYSEYASALPTWVRNLEDLKLLAELPNFQQILIKLESQLPQLIYHFTDGHLLIDRITKTIPNEITLIYKNHFAVDSRNLELFFQDISTEEVKKLTQNDFFKIFNDPSVLKHLFKLSFEIFTAIYEKLNPQEVINSIEDLNNFTKKFSKAEVNLLYKYFIEQNEFSRWLSYPAELLRLNAPFEMICQLSKEIQVKDPSCNIGQVVQALSPENFFIFCEIMKVDCSFLIRTLNQLPKEEYKNFFIKMKPFIFQTEGGINEFFKSLNGERYKLLSDVLHDLLINSLASFLRSLRLDSTQLLSESFSEQEEFSLKEVLEIIDFSVVKEIFTSLRPQFLSILEKSQNYLEFSIFLSQIPDNLIILLIDQIKDTFRSFDDLIKVLNEIPDRLGLYNYFSHDLLKDTNDLILLLQAVPESAFPLFWSAIEPKASKVITTQEDLKKLTQFISNRSHGFTAFLKDKEKFFVSAQQDLLSAKEKEGESLFQSFAYGLDNIKIEKHHSELAKEIDTEERVQYEHINNAFKKENAFLNGLETTIIEHSKIVKDQIEISKLALTQKTAREKLEKSHIDDLEEILKEIKTRQYVSQAAFSYIGICLDEYNITLKALKKVADHALKITDLLENESFNQAENRLLQALKAKPNPLYKGAVENLHEKIQEAKINLKQTGFVEGFKVAYLKAIQEARPILGKNNELNTMLKTLCYIIKALFKGKLDFSDVAKHKWSLFSVPKDSEEKLDNLQTNLMTLN